MDKSTRVSLIVAAAVLLLAVAGAAVAGHHGGDRHLKADPAAHAAKLAEVLALDAAQTADVEQILAEARTEREAIGDRYTLNQRAEAKEEMRALQDRTAERIASLLNAEQRETFDAMQEKRRMRAKHRQEMRELRREQREERRSET